MNIELISPKILNPSNITPEMLPILHDNKPI